MPYTLDIWCDGACRNNGRRGVAVVGGWGVYIPRYPSGVVRASGPILNDLDQGNTSATSNRAELQALIKALEYARDVTQHLQNSNTVVISNIRLDSSYTQRCMTEWRYKWENNGWRTSNGDPVKNQDLIEVAADICDEIRRSGDKVNILKIDRSYNVEADRLANEGCDEAATYRYDYGY